MHTDVRLLDSKWADVFVAEALRLKVQKNAYRRTPVGHTWADVFVAEAIRLKVQRNVRKEFILEPNPARVDL